MKNTHRQRGGCDEWQTARDKYLVECGGLGLMKQRKELKEMLMRLMKGNKTHSKAFIGSKGLESLQTALHVYCEAKLSSQSTQKKC